jgi:hypothetical protein
MHFSVAHECSQNLLYWFHIEVMWFPREYVEYHKVVEEAYFVCCEAHTLNNNLELSSVQHSCTYIISSVYACYSTGLLIHTDKN